VAEQEHLSEGRPVIYERDACVYLDERVVPDLADDRGFLRAGKILEWMEVIAVVAAKRHSRLPVVKASVDGMVLRDPIRVGGRVTMTALVTHTSKRSTGVSVSMTCAGPEGDHRRSVLKAYLSFVVMDDSGVSSSRAA
jgi:acyl-CoA hydrolase